MLTQKEFEVIINNQKFINESIIIGDLTSKSYQIFFENEEFNNLNAYLDIHRSGSIEIKHGINNRVKTSIPILRLDINGHHHSNPIFDENLIKDFEIENNLIELMKKYSGYKFTKESHLHYYIEPFREKWAFPPIEFNINVSNDFQQNIRNFCDNFNIEVSIKKEGLF